MSRKSKHKNNELKAEPKKFRKGSFAEIEEEVNRKRTERLKKYGKA